MSPLPCHIFFLLNIVMISLVRFLVLSSSIHEPHPSLITPSTAPIFEVRLNQNFVENLPRKNTTITTFHAVSKEGTGLFTDLPSFCYRDCFLFPVINVQKFTGRALFFLEILDLAEDCVTVAKLVGLGPSKILVKSPKVRFNIANRWEKLSTLHHLS